MAGARVTSPRIQPFIAPVKAEKPAETIVEKAAMMAEQEPPIKAEVIDTPLDEVVSEPIGPLIDDVNVITDNLGTSRKTRVQIKAEKSAKKWIGMGVVALYSNGDQYCASALGTVGKEVAESLGEVANQFPWLAEMLGESDKYTAVLGLIYNVGRLGIMIGVHHDWVPYNTVTSFFVPDPKKPFPLPNKEE
jgi:hypothetical protein